MAREPNKPDVADDNEDRKKEYAGLGWDKQRQADEAKDRERLKKEHVRQTPEEIGKLMTERDNLRTEHESKLQELRAGYLKAKHELDVRIGAGFEYVPGDQPTNETLEGGVPRRLVKAYG